MVHYLEFSSYFLFLGCWTPSCVHFLNYLKEGEETFCSLNVYFPEACGDGANSYRGGWGILKSWANRYREGSRNFLLFFLMTELICLIESLLGRTVGWCVGRVAVSQLYSGCC